MIVVLKLFI